MESINQTPNKGTLIPTRYLNFPGCILQGACRNCGKLLQFSLEHNCLDHPRVGVERSLSVDCPGCETPEAVRFYLTVHLSLSYRTE